MRILQVIASLAPRYGGPSVACPALCRELARRGHEVSVYSTDVDGDRRLDVPLDRPMQQHGVEYRYFRGWTRPGEYKFSPPLWRALREKIPTVDLVHIYSMYIFSATAAAHFCRKYRVPYLLHPHGTLDPYLLRRHAARKRVYTRLFERRKFRHAAAILFNSAEEMRLAKDWFDREFHLSRERRLPTRAVVPVGVEQEWLAPAAPEARERFYKRFPELAGRRMLLFYGRLSFKKGMDILAEAFIEVAHQQHDVHLVLAGPDTEGYGEKVRGWLRAGGVLDRAIFTGNLAGAERIAVMQDSKLLAFPSYSENFGQAVVEAMASGVPVVVSDRVNIWPEVQQAGAGLIVACDPHETAKALLVLLRNPALGEQMGARGRQWVEEHLTWRVVGDQMVRLYEQLVRPKALPGALPSLRGERAVVR